MSNRRKRGGAQLVHPAVATGAYLPIDPAQAQRDLQIAERMAAAERGEMAYDAGTGQGATPVLARANDGLRMERQRGGAVVYDTGTGEGATPVFAREYQREGRNVGAGYLNNPFEDEGRERIGQQFWEAPLGGHVRGALEGQELFGHRITGGQARITEQALAGLTAVGVGVPTFLAAVHNLSTPPDQGTIPL